MGYEIKLYIVEKHDQKYEDKNYAEVIATFDMCKFSFGNLFKKETDCYIFADDGNTRVLEDRYDEPLKEEDIINVIKYLEEYKETHQYYRRVDPLLSLLRGFSKGGWQDLKILSYGH